MKDFEEKRRKKQATDCKMKIPDKEQGGRYEILQKIAKLLTNLIDDFQASVSKATKNYKKKTRKVLELDGQEVVDLSNDEKGGALSEKAFDMK